MDIIQSETRRQQSTGTVDSFLSRGDPGVVGPTAHEGGYNCTSVHGIWGHRLHPMSMAGETTIIERKGGTQVSISMKVLSAHPCRLVKGSWNTRMVKLADDVGR